MLKLPVVLLNIDSCPIVVLEPPVSFEYKVDAPIAVFPPPLFVNKEANPIAVLLEPPTLE